MACLLIFFLCVGGLSRFTRSLKALRALRLITLVDRMRTTFESLLISGALRILDAAILAVLYLIPYAVWGLNVFSGRMGLCNDDSVLGLDQCTGVFSQSLYGGNDGTLSFMVPRVWDYPNPSTKYSFDSFRDALLILFEVTSVEGWSDLLGSTTSIAGPGLQPITNNSQVEAIFLVVFHLTGALMVGTLFVRQVDCYHFSVIANLLTFSPLQYYHRKFQCEDGIRLSYRTAKRVD